MLAALIARRLVRMVRPPRSFDELASLLSAPSSCSEALRALDRSAAQVLAVLAGGGGRAEPERLAALLGLEEREVLASLGRAERLALAWPAGNGTWRSAGGAAHVAREVLQRGVPYDELLGQLGIVELRAVLGRLGLGSARSRDDALAVLEQVLPRRAAAALEEATGARELLTSLARTGETPRRGRRRRPPRARPAAARAGPRLPARRGRAGAESRPGRPRRGAGAAAAGRPPRPAAGRCRPAAARARRAAARRAHRRPAHAARVRRVGRAGAPPAGQGGRHRPPPRWCCCCS